MMNNLRSLLTPYIGLLLIVAGTANSQTVLITSPQTLSPGQITVTPTGGGAPVPLVTADIIVRGTTLTVNGEHTIRSLVVEGSAGNAPGIVTHANAFVTGFVEGMRLTVTQDARIQGASGSLVASSIDVSSRGYNWQVSGSDTGPGTGDIAACFPGSGGGYGGAGGRGSCNPRRGPAYGSDILPMFRGSEGNSRGGNGGGACVLRVGGVLQLDGRINANGQNTPGGLTDGGGSGGSVLIMAGTLAGTGSVTANGGNGNNPAGGGAGGRISIYACDRSAFAPSQISVNGGAGFQPGDPGTVYHHPQPAVFNIKTQPEALLWGIGETATFTVEAFGVGTFTYQWRKDGAPLSDGGRFSGTTAPTLSISLVEPGDAGVYDCVVSSSMCGSITTDPAPMTVRAQECIGTWTLMSTTGPAPRYGYGMAFDPVRGNTVLFGGTTVNSESGRRSDTWTWDGVAWTSRPVTGPSARLESPLVFDEQRGVAILTGGYLGSNQRGRDTWEWNGSAWSLRTSTAPRRSNHVLLYRPVENLTYLFTGYDESSGRGGVDDVWVWNGSTWTQRPSMPCQPRLDAAAWIRGDGAIELFGGYFTILVPLGDQWELNTGGVWTRRNASAPAPRWHAFDTVDRITDTPLLYGGTPRHDGVTYVADDSLWARTPEGWRKTSARGPGPRVAGTMAHDLGRDRIVLFGGALPSGNLGDTWELAIKRPPAIGSNAQDITTCVGGSAQFEALGTGGAPLSYQWRRDGLVLQDGETPVGSQISGATTPTLVITNAAESDEGDYDVVISNSCGSVTTQPATLTVCACLACPADFNQDGGIDGTDVSYFFDRWEVGNCDADVNADGGTDGADVDAFFAAWEAGGCG